MNPASAEATLGIQIDEQHTTMVQWLLQLLMLLFGMEYGKEKTDFDQEGKNEFA